MRMFFNVKEHSKQDAKRKETTCERTYCNKNNWSRYSKQANGIYNYCLHNCKCFMLKKYFCIALAIRFDEAFVVHVLKLVTTVFLTALIVMSSDPYKSFRHVYNAVVKVLKSKIISLFKVLNCCWYHCFALLKCYYYIKIQSLRASSSRYRCAHL